MQLASAGVKFPTPLRIVDDVVEIRKLLFLREVSQNVDVPILETICGKDIVVWYNDYLLWIPDLRLLAELTLKNTDTSRTANVMRQKDVGIYPNIFSGGDLALIGTASEDLFRERHRGWNLRPTGDQIKRKTLIYLLKCVTGGDAGSTPGAIVVGVVYLGGARTVSAFLRTLNRTGVVPTGLPST